MLGGCCGILSGVFGNLCAQNYGNDVRKDAFSRIMSLSFEQTDRFTTGSLITRVTNDVTQLQNLVISASGDLFGPLCSLQGVLSASCCWI